MKLKKKNLKKLSTKDLKQVVGGNGVTTISSIDITTARGDEPPAG
ncbi:bacteriocin [Pseudoalteromonas luteoviolacea]|nr:bacteriocin [Pseudoalteromonas luteoviolacea]MBQ4809919.1 bacteriocin [Pseudoalteromonas luteoviolacea]